MFALFFLEIILEIWDRKEVYQFVRCHIEKFSHHYIIDSQLKKTVEFVTSYLLNCEHYCFVKKIQKKILNCTLILVTSNIVTMANLYPSLEDMKVDQMMQVCRIYYKRIYSRQIITTLELFTTVPHYKIIKISGTSTSNASSV